MCRKILSHKGFFGILDTVSRYPADAITRQVERESSQTFSNRTSFCYSLVICLHVKSLIFNKNNFTRDRVPRGSALRTS